MRFSVSHCLAALLSPAILCACSTDPKPVAPLITIAARNCPASFDLSRAESLPFDGKQDSSTPIDIVETSPCISTAVGASTYVVYGLPQNAVPYVIRVSSIAAGTTLFAPRVTLFGRDGAKKREFSGSALAFRGDGIGVVFRSHADEAYLVVASDPVLIGRTESRIVEATQGYASSPTFQFYTGTDTKVGYTFAHNGRVVVTLSPLETKPN